MVCHLTIRIFSSLYPGSGIALTLLILFVLFTVCVIADITVDFNFCLPRDAL